MNEFDERAKTWDTNPMHLQRSIAIAEELNSRIPLNKGMTALEFGAGTGILGFLLAESLKSVVLMETSAGMVEVMKEKVEHLKPTNVLPVVHDLTLQSYSERFDLIVSQMVFHHIQDIAPLLSQFFEAINPGGYLAIADLLTEDGSFHGTGFDGHLGFDPIQLTIMVEAAGFKSVKLETCFVIHKQTSNGMKDFPIFLLTACR